MIGYLIVSINSMLLGIVMGITVHANRVKYAKRMEEIKANDPLRPQY